MGTLSTIILIVSIVGVGFGTGIHLGLMDDSASLYNIKNLLSKDVSAQGLPFFNLAFMSGGSSGLISHATVGFGLGSVVVDPDESPNNGDEYFDNRITECKFHSNEDIDEPICVVCRLADTHDECVDLFLNFIEFEHGTILGNDQGFPNAVIPGVTITAVANTHSGGGKNAAIIFDGDTPGDLDESPTPDPDLRASGICAGCAGKRIVIIAENTGGGSDGIVDVPDDNAIGGTQTWVFDKPWFVNSFDFVDYDNASINGQARAYDNPSCTGTPIATAAITKIPNGGDGSVQTIFLGANNVRCLQFEYHDSGGVTNVDLECIKNSDPENVIATGLVDLPDGYTASTVVPIPLFDGGVDVFEVQSAQIEIGKSLIDFAGLSHGDNFATVKGYLSSNFGITLEVDGFNGIDEAIIYDSNFLGLGGTGFDPDLEHPLVPDDPDIGNLLIMKENSSNQPNDSAAGGIIRFKSADPMSYVSIDVVDHERNGATSQIKAYQTFGCTGPFVSADIVPLVDRSVQTVIINADNVKCLEIFYEDSGGFTNLRLTCAGAFHLRTEGCTPGYWKTHPDSWVGFFPTDLVGSVFTSTPATSGNTLLEALNFMGGTDLVGAEKILLRAAVAGILSASHPDVDYPRTVGDIITAVNSAIASANRDTMLALAGEIDIDNNRGCPLNGGSTSEKFFSDSFEDNTTISGIWNKDTSRTTTPNPGRIIFGQGSAGEIGPHTGQKYLAGSGDIVDRVSPFINPAWAAYNRNSIDISQHSDVLLSFWYSYDNTESSDEFAMYYRVDGGAWQEIFFVNPSTVSNQQLPWVQLQVAIPDGNNLDLQFRWETSAGAGDDVVMIDDLEVWGILI